LLLETYGCGSHKAGFRRQSPSYVIVETIPIAYAQSPHELSMAVASAELQDRPVCLQAIVDAGQHPKLLPKFGVSGIRSIGRAALPSTGIRD